MSPPRKYSKQELEHRCDRCFAPATTQCSSDKGSSPVAKIPVKNDFAKELDRIKQMDTLFAQFRASVDVDEKEALEAFLKLMEGPPDVEPTEFHRMD